MRYIFSLPASDALSIVRHLPAPDTARLRRDLIDLLGLESSANDGVMAGIIGARLRPLVSDVRSGMGSADLPSQLEEAGLAFTPKVILCEMIFQGFDSAYEGAADVLLPHLVEWWTAGAEGILILSHDYKAAVMLMHYGELRAGDLTSADFLDEAMVQRTLAQFRNIPWRKAT